MRVDRGQYIWLLYVTPGREKRVGMTGNGGCEMGEGGWEMGDGRVGMRRDDYIQCV